MNPQEINNQPSKTQIKKEMEQLQQLGLRLTKLSKETLNKMSLPDELREAIAAYQKINSNSALKRQAQYIGRLMRTVETEPIEEYLARLSGENTAYNAFLQRIEQWRTLLLEDDTALERFIESHPDTDTVQIRTLIRNARKEKSLDKPPRAYRALFQEIKSALENAQNSQIT